MVGDDRDNLIFFQSHFSNLSLPKHQWLDILLCNFHRLICALRIFLATAYENCASMLVAVCHLMIDPRTGYPLQKPHICFYHALYFPRRLSTLRYRLTRSSQDTSQGAFSGPRQDSGASTSYNIVSLIILCTSDLFKISYHWVPFFPRCKLHE